MSLLAKKNIGLVIISALLIFSCKEKEKIGLQLPEDNVGTFYTDTLSLSTSVIFNDDSISNRENYLFAGAYDDPRFGDVSASAYTQLWLKDESKVATYSSIDSVVMTLTYDYAYGDFSPGQKLEVKELQDPLDKNTSYFTSSPAPNVEPTRLDQDLPFDAKRASPSNVKKQKIYLTNAFGVRLLDAIGTGTTNNNFVENVKGIAITPSESNKGAIVRFKIYDNTSIVKVYFKNASSGNDSVELQMNKSGVRFSKVESVNVPPLTDAKVVYLQSGLGIGTKISFPTLENLKSKLGNIAINRAELILEVDKTTVKDGAITYDLIGAVNLAKLDVNGNTKKYLNSGTLSDVVVQRDFFDVKGTSAPSVASPDTSSSLPKYRYTLNVSSYFHALVNGFEENNGLLIVPISDIASVSFNRTVADKVYLRIYYTRVD